MCAANADETNELKNAINGRRQIARLLALAEKPKAISMAVVHPVDYNSISGALEAARLDLIVPVLVGPKHKIAAAADLHQLDISGLEIVDAEHSHAAADIAVALAKEGRVAALMKGKIHTDEYMRAIISRNAGIRTERRMSHIYVADFPSYHKPLMISDGAINIFPGLMEKKDIVQNAIDLAHAIEVALPKVALLSATEEINPVIPSTIDAAALCKMADRKQITGALLDGPLAFDNAISRDAAKTKGIDSPVAGDADILIAPDLEAANMLAKQLSYFSDAALAALVLGARVPIVLTSRADGALSRVASCALALLVSEYEKEQMLSGFRPGR
jgi:phosphotransacetylase